MLADNNIKNCFRIGCSNRSEEIVTYPIDRYRTKKVVFCKACLDQLTSEGIIHDHKIRPYYASYI